MRLQDNPLRNLPSLPLPTTRKRNCSPLAFSLAQPYHLRSRATAAPLVSNPGESLSYGMGSVEAAFLTGRQDGDPYGILPQPVAEALSGRGTTRGQDGHTTGLRLRRRDDWEPIAGGFEVVTDEEVATGEGRRVPGFV